MGDDDRAHSVTVVDSDVDWQAAVDLRMAVFVDEQGVPADLELDEYDENPLTSPVDHLLVRDDAEEAVAVARLRAVDGDAYGSDADRVAKVERVVVARERRGEDWGRRVMDAVEARAQERGLDEAVLHAQVTARGFYERLGYAVDDAVGVFEEDGIDHVRMRKAL